MANNNKTYVTIHGNLVADPELRTTRDGATYTTFRVAVTSRQFLREENQFVDAETSYYSVTAFGALAVNVLNCAKKGQPVIVHAAQTINEWQTREGETRHEVRLTAEHMGHSLRLGRSEFRKDTRPILDAVAAQQPQVDDRPAEAYDRPEGDDTVASSGPLVPPDEHDAPDEEPAPERAYEVVSASS
ncbi:single-stranded DNA-binding protein [Barrientosiimonas humi]|uniref:single-stranded DNA-binding protein n=1 Tax=Barrientosiimonas humi TaxID=999931 RepID=UPI00370D14B1